MGFGFVKDYRWPLSSLVNWQPQEIGYASGAAMLIKRAVLESAGLFDEKFFSYLNIVEKIIQRGKEQKIFNVDINAGILKRAIFGAIDEIALEWVLMKKKRYSIEEASYELCQMFVKGLK